MSDVQLERRATCPQHGRVMIELERTTDPPATFGYHRKGDGRWCRFRVRSWETRQAPTL